MKTLIAAFAALTLTACASTAPYMHDKETHARAVAHHVGQLQPTFPSWQDPARVSVEFSVERAGTIGALSVEGGSSRQQQRSVEILHDAAPFPPHDEPEPITYSTEVVFP